MCRDRFQVSNAGSAQPDQPEPITPVADRTSAISLQGALTAFSRSPAVSSPSSSPLDDVRVVRTTRLDVYRIDG